jgi:hypothetical protein
MKRFVLLLAMMSAAATAGAQNLIQNPAFDENATGWDLSMYSTWSNRVDHGDSPFSGALQITTRTTDSDTQCIDIRGTTRYAISLWVEKDPQPSLSPCSGTSSGAMVHFFNAKQCSGPEAGQMGFARRLPEPEGWQHFLGTFTTDGTTQSASLSLDAECSGGGGISIHYFDDIFIGPDSIMKADFEVHAPEGGPAQPPGG